MVPIYGTDYHTERYHVFICLTLCLVGKDVFLICEFLSLAPEGLSGIARITFLMATLVSAHEAILVISYATMILCQIRTFFTIS